MVGHGEPTIVPLTATIGARIEGLDLRQPLDEQQQAAVRQALFDHLVIFFRDQDLDEDQHLAFARAFGDPRSQSMSPEGDTNWFVTVEDTPESPPKADHWHTDMAFVADPPEIAVLNMREMPPLGGDTLWASLYAVFEGLSPTMQRFVLELEAEHGIGAQLIRHAKETRGDEYQRQILEDAQVMRHPLVRMHPETGKPAVYFGGAEYTTGIAGLAPDESEWLIRLIRSRIEQPQVQCRWRWQPYDVAVWDERCTNHRALSDHYPDYRRIRRCLVGQSAPVGMPTGVEVLT